MTGEEERRLRSELDAELAHLGMAPANNDMSLPQRRDCAFCGRERSAHDDNHAPECPYWDFFTGGQ